jgi:plasmid stabilization system protein ParE
VVRRRLLLHPAAQSEVVEAYSHAGEPPEVARAFRSYLRTAVARILERPETYARFDGEIRRYLLTPKYPYALLYEILDDDTIYVLAVMHLRRHPDYWKAR